MTNDKIVTISVIVVDTQGIGFSYPFLLLFYKEREMVSCPLQLNKEKGFDVHFIPSFEVVFMILFS